MSKNAVKSNEEIQREILDVDLETKRLGLDEARKRNATFAAAEQRRSSQNKERQANIAEERRMHRRNQLACAHAAGGEAGTSPLEGGGKFSFSVIARVILPDGKHELLLCPRCRLKLIGREHSKAEERMMKLAAEAAEEKFPETYGDDAAWIKWDDHKRWKDLRKVSQKEGIPNNVLRGPTFMFEKDGVPFIPELR